MVDPNPDASRIALGLWPIAGITTVGVTQSDARATIATAIDCGIRRFDTAFSYGYEGQCDRYLGEFITQQRDQFTILSKVGQRWSGDHQRVIDGSPQTLITDAEESLRRIGTERFDCLMLHSPDPKIDIRVSAEAIESLQRRGLCDKIGVCNVTADQRRLFASAASCDAIQCPLNLLQRDALSLLIPDCSADDCEVFTFWTLMKGLLAGRISRQHVFADNDVRPTYPIFQGRARERAHNVVDKLSALGKTINTTVAQLAVGWVLAQRGVTAALVGARTPDQIRELAASVPLRAETCDAIESIVQSQT
ncbi:MAG: aldo/keto reductase [Pirellulaceae bacterium]|nr:aldo/keto reductase [Pirellulaceae bacterium]